MSRAVILSTGDELTTGRVVDTNSAYIADKLYGLGFDVAAVLKVGDDRERLLWALATAAAVSVRPPTISPTKLSPNFWGSGSCCIQAWSRR
jgi:hypothetical protein